MSQPELVVTLDQLHRRTSEVVSCAEAGQAVKVIDGRRCRCADGQCTCPARARLVPGDVKAGMTAALPELLSRAAGVVVDLIATAAEPDDMALTVDAADALDAIRQEAPSVVVAAGLAGGITRGWIQAGIAADGRLVYGLTADGWLDHWTRQVAI